MFYYWLIGKEIHSLCITQICIFSYLHFQFVNCSIMFLQLPSSSIRLETNIQVSQASLKKNQISSCIPQSVQFPDQIFVFLLFWTANYITTTESKSGWFFSLPSWIFFGLISGQRFDVNFGMGNPNRKL